MSTFPQAQKLKIGPIAPRAHQLEQLRHGNEAEEDRAVELWDWKGWTRGRGKETIGKETGISVDEDKLWLQWRDYEKNGQGAEQFGLKSAGTQIKQPKNTKKSRALTWTFLGPIYQKRLQKERTQQEIISQGVHVISRFAIFSRQRRYFQRNQVQP